MLLDESFHILEVLGQSQDKRRSIVFVQLGQHLFEEFFVAIVMDVNIHKATLSGLAEQTPARQSKQYTGEPRSYSNGTVRFHSVLARDSSRSSASVQSGTAARRSHLAPGW